MERNSLDKMFYWIDHDLDFINQLFRLVSSEEKRELFRDIKYVFLDQIAREVRFVFYEEESKSTIYYQYIYTSSGERKEKGSFQLVDLSLEPHVAFDVFIEFTDSFLKMDKKKQSFLLNNAEYEWHV